MVTGHGRYRQLSVPARSTRRRRTAADETAAVLGSLVVWVITPLVVVGAIVGGVLLALPSLAG